MRHLVPTEFALVDKLDYAGIKQNIDIIIFYINNYYIEMMNKYLVEFLGTMFLMFVIFATGNYLAIGAALAIGVLLGGPISSGAFNPAVTIALYAAGKLPKGDVIPYMIVQIMGALAALTVYKNFVNRA